MILVPHYIPGFDPKTNPFFAFGESYGGPHVLQLAVGSNDDDHLVLTGTKTMMAVAKMMMTKTI